MGVSMRSQATTPGVRADALSRWLAEAVGADPPLSFHLIPGGRSNLTYQAVDQRGRTWIVRRPPVGDLLPTAHDMGREFRILRALEHTPVPVPRAVAYSDDTGVTGAPFYVMEFVEGRVLHDELPADLTPDFVTTLGGSFVDTLAELHMLDPDRIGLGDLGRRQGYISRQLRRWHGQFTCSTSRAVPLVEEVHQRLLAAVPAQTAVAIVHGDYRVENCLVAKRGPIAAVLDWETCTLGEPLADLAQVVVGWPTTSGVDALVDRYHDRTGFDLTDLPYFVAFVRWRTACILEAVHARYSRGAAGGDSSNVSQYLERVVEEVELARRTLDDAEWIQPADRARPDPDEELP
jgi:aminoglycoside phosphotransferase (APT) family kinase protein